MANVVTAATRVNSPRIGEEPLRAPAHSGNLLHTLQPADPFTCREFLETLIRDRQWGAQDGLTRSEWQAAIQKWNQNHSKPISFSFPEFSRRANCWIGNQKAISFDGLRQMEQGLVPQAPNSAFTFRPFLNFLVENANKVGLRDEGITQGGFHAIVARWNDIHRNNKTMQVACDAGQFATHARGGEFSDAIEYNELKRIYESAFPLQDRRYQFHYCSIDPAGPCSIRNVDFLRQLFLKGPEHIKQNGDFSFLSIFHEVQNWNASHPENQRITLTEQEYRGLIHRRGFRGVGMIDLANTFREEILKEYSRCKRDLQEHHLRINHSSDPRVRSIEAVQERFYNGRIGLLNTMSGFLHQHNEFANSGWGDLNAELRKQIIEIDRKQNAIGLALHESQKLQDKAENLEDRGRGLARQGAVSKANRYFAEAAVDMNRSVRSLAATDARVDLRPLNSMINTVGRDAKRAADISNSVAEFFHFVRDQAVVTFAVLSAPLWAAPVAAGGSVAMFTATVAGGTASGFALGGLTSYGSAALDVALGNKTKREAFREASITHAQLTQSSFNGSLVMGVGGFLGTLWANQAATVASTATTRTSLVAAVIRAKGSALIATTGATIIANISSAHDELTQAKEAFQEINRNRQWVSSTQRAQEYEAFLAKRGLSIPQLLGRFGIDMATNNGAVLLSPNSAAQASRNKVSEFFRQHFGNAASEFANCIFTGRPAIASSFNFAYATAASSGTHMPRSRSRSNDDAVRYKTGEETPMPQREFTPQATRSSGNSFDIESPTPQRISQDETVRPVNQTHWDTHEGEVPEHSHLRVPESETTVSGMREVWEGEYYRDSAKFMSDLASRCPIRPKGKFSQPRITSDQYLQSTSTWMETVNGKVHTYVARWHTKTSDILPGALPTYVVERQCGAERQVLVRSKSNPSTYEWIDARVVEEARRIQGRGLHEYERGGSLPDSPEAWDLLRRAHIPYDNRLGGEKRD